MNQLGFPSEVTGQEVMRERDLGGAISLCAKAAGLEAKQVQDLLKADKAQFSRWLSGAGRGLARRARRGRLSVSERRWP